MALVSTPPLAVPPLSFMLTVMVATPGWLAAGVKVSVPLGLIAGPALNIAGLLLLTTWKVTVCAASSAGPVLIAVAQGVTVCAVAFCNTLTSAPLTKLGASLTAVTLITKLCVALVSTPPSAVPPLSLMRTVRVAVPLALAAGVKVRSPLAPLTAGAALNKAALLLLTISKLSVCADSQAAPALRAVAHPATVCAAASSSTVTSAPLLKLGA